MSANYLPRNHDKPSTLPSHKVHAILHHNALSLPLGQTSSPLCFFTGGPTSISHCGVLFCPLLMNNNKFDEMTARYSTLSNAEQSPMKAGMHAQLAVSTQQSRLYVYIQASHHSTLLEYPRRQRFNETIISSLLLIISFMELKKAAGSSSCRTVYVDPHSLFGCKMTDKIRGILRGICVN